MAVVVAGGPVASAETRAHDARGAYRTLDLGSLGGGVSTAAAVNDRGWVAGNSLTADAQDHAFLWNPYTRSMRDLGDLGEVADLNNRREVITARGAVWRARTGKATAIPFSFEVGWGRITLNDRGEVALFRPGDGDTWDVGVWNVRTHRWKSLRCPVGDPNLSCPSESDRPSGVNNRGQVIAVPSCSTCPVLLWDPQRRRWGTVISLSDDVPAALSNRGVVVGRDLRCTSSPVDFVAVDTRRGRRTCLPLEPIDVSDRGVVLGREAVFDLRSHVTLTLPRPRMGATTWSAAALNRRGEVVGSLQTVDGTTHAVLWRPRC